VLKLANDLDGHWLVGLGFDIAEDTGSGVGNAVSFPEVEQIGTDHLRAQIVEVVRDHHVEQAFIAGDHFTAFDCEDGQPNSSIMCLKLN